MGALISHLHVWPELEMPCLLVNLNLLCLCVFPVSQSNHGVVFSLLEVYSK